MQEQEANEKLRVSVKQQDLQVEKLRRQLREQAEGHREEEQRRQGLGSMDSREWKATVVGKLAEDKVKELQDDLDKKVGLPCSACWGHLGG